MRTGRLVAVATFVAMSGSAAHADLAGTLTTLHTTTAPDQTQGVARDIFRVYVLFDNPADRMHVVFGVESSPLNISVNGGNVYNPFASNVPLNADQLASTPQAEWDSFITINLLPGYDHFQFSLILSPGFPTIVPNEGISNDTDVAWISLGTNTTAGNGVAFGDLWGLLVMQIAVDAGTSPSGPSGSFGINYFPGGLSGEPTIVENVTFAIPSPGVLSLLAMAACSPRRRRS